ncbi:MAG: Rpn family recombination-promoting nuclease/putative transposase [bacterium]|nr:Rpn family recombination-promoting nuclease/putative transposase [bacterium]
MSHFRLEWPKREKTSLPVIIPLVLYYGEDHWEARLNFRDLFDSPLDILSFISDFQYLLWDASGYKDEEIKGEVMLRVVLLLLKHIFQEDLRDRLPGILGLLRDLAEKRTGLEYIETILKYIVNAAPTITYEDLKGVVDEVLADKVLR